MNVLSVGITAVIALWLGMMLVLGQLPTIVPLAEDARTDDATEVALVCTTGIADTSCAITLADIHEYNDTTQMTVTETAPGSGDRTSNTTVAADRVTLTIASLATSTAYTFTTAYKIQAADISGPLNDLLRFLPLLIPLGLVALVLIAVIRSLGLIRG